jgi:hypothetical protein
MDEIVDAVKENSGIRIQYRKGEDTDQTTFSFQELIDNEVNIYHLIQYPGKYRIDIEAHRIVRKQHGQ